jgi:hypothetical protein
MDEPPRKPRPRPVRPTCDMYQFAHMSDLRLPVPRRGVTMEIGRDEYGAGTALRLADGRESLNTEPRVGSGPVRRPFASPRDSDSTVPPVSASQVSLPEGSYVASTSMVGNYWLPRLSVPLTSRQPWEGRTNDSSVIKPILHGRDRPEIPPNWSLSPTPMSRHKKHRYTLPGQMLTSRERQIVDYEKDQQLQSHWYGHMDPTSISKLRKATTNMKMQDWRQAALELNQLLEMHPTVAHLYTVQAMCFYKLGNYHKAFSNGKKALHLDPAENRANYYAGMAAARLGKTKLGSAYLETALQNAPASQKYRRSFEKLLTQTANERKFFNLPFSSRLKPPKAIHGHRELTPEPERVPVVLEATAMDDSWRTMARLSPSFLLGFTTQSAMDVLMPFVWCAGYQRYRV